jgi:hypothetical protein
MPSWAQTLKTSSKIEVGIVYGSAVVQGGGRASLSPAGDDLVVFSTAHARRVHNSEQRPTVTLHFNSDPDGGDDVVITGVAALAPSQRPSALGAYLDKYEATITGPLGTTVGRNRPDLQHRDPDPTDPRPTDTSA